MNAKAEPTGRDIMQTAVLSVEEDWPLYRPAAFLTDNQISGAPVISSENGSLIGVVSLTDIVRHNGTPEGRSPETGTHEYYLHNLESHIAGEEVATCHIENESSTTVRDIMTPMIFQVPENTTVQDAADTMVRGHIHRLLVTRDKRIAGIVTALDILKTLQQYPDRSGLLDIA